MGTDASPGAVTRQVAGEVLLALPGETRKVIPPAVIIALIQALSLVVQACYPQPVHAAEFLTPPVGWFGIPRQRWERRIRNAVADKWKGTGLADVQNAVVARIRRGVDPDTLGRLYAEAGSQRNQ